MVPALVQRCEARQGSPFNNLQLPIFLLLFFFFIPSLSPVPTPSSQHPPDLPATPREMWWPVFISSLLHPDSGLLAVSLQVFVEALKSPRGPEGLTVQERVCMGIRDHGSAAGTGLSAQPADGECSGAPEGRWGPGSAQRQPGPLLLLLPPPFAADMLKIALLYPAGSFEMISWVKGVSHDKALSGKKEA